METKAKWCIITMSTCKKKKYGGFDGRFVDGGIVHSPDKGSGCNWPDGFCLAEFCTIGANLGFANWDIFGLHLCFFYSFLGYNIENWF